MSRERGAAVRIQCLSFANMSGRTPCVRESPRLCSIRVRSGLQGLEGSEKAPLGRFPRTTEQKVGTGRADRLPHSLALVATEVVHHDHIAGSEGGGQNPFDIGSEDVAVHGTVEHPRRIDAVMAQGRDERGGVPVPEGSRPGQAFAFGRPAPQRGHVCLHHSP